MSLSVHSVAITLLTHSSAATTTDRSTDVLVMASPELTGTNQAISSEKRSLRYHDNGDHTDGEEECDSEEVRRGTNIFATEKLDEMLVSVKRARNGDDGGMEKVYKKLAKWRKAKYPYKTSAVVDQEKYLKLRQAYRNWAY
ncbi:Putative RxLR effector [Phytophthora palmivora]|uniref:RxLR effector protein n=1 Tax=Phytophthora palmivora TaxID=4796 RepID=A0A2P4XU60_9STRA|nr:Putative RxLR effector [Phytophthora palmivora]